MKKPVKRLTPRRAKPEKRVRVPSRLSIATRHLIQPDESRPFYVALLLSPSRRQMLATIKFTGAPSHANDPRTMGMVRKYTSHADGRPVVRPGQIIAHMYLNGDDLRADASNILPHECTHAAMAWATLQKANLKNMEGEEVLCHAVGEMSRRVNQIAHMMGVWK